MGGGQALTTISRVPEFRLEEQQFGAIRHRPAPRAQHANGSRGSPGKVFSPAAVPVFPNHWPWRLVSAAAKAQEGRHQLPRSRAAARHPTLRPGRPDSGQDRIVPLATACDRSHPNIVIASGARYKTLNRCPGRRVLKVRGVSIVPIATVRCSPEATFAVAGGAIRHCKRHWCFRILQEGTPHRAWVWLYSAETLRGRNQPRSKATIALCQGGS